MRLTPAGISRSISFSCLALAAWFCFMHGHSADAQAPADAASGPQYDQEGQLKLPADFRTWILAGSNMGLDYREDVAKESAPKKDQEKKDSEKKDGEKKDAEKKTKPANFHNVYINPEAYREYVRTGTFPEKTMLVLDVYSAEESEPRNIVASGRFPGKQVGLAMAVKNSARPDGSKTAWAYYDFSLDRAAGKLDAVRGTAPAFPNSACFDCHLKHADVDNVWVQFYPTLLKARAAK
jgi:hypothetical protein